MECPESIQRKYLITIISHYIAVGSCKSTIGLGIGLGMEIYQLVTLVSAPLFLL